jgi:hypothetical protein
LVFLEWITGKKICAFQPWKVALSKGFKSSPRLESNWKGWNISKHSKVGKGSVSESEMSLKFLYTPPPFFFTTEKGFKKTFDIKI